MTNEELINELYFIKNWKCNGDSKMHNVICEAIKALERQEKTLSYIDRLLNQGTGKKKSLEFLKKYILEGEKNDNIPNDHGNSISCHTDNQDNAEPHIAVSSAQGV